MREEVLVLPPFGERRKAGFSLSKTHEALFNISRKCVAPDVITYVKRSSHFAGSKKPENASEFISEAKKEADILRREDHSKVPLLGLVKPERIDGEVFSKHLMMSLVSVSAEQTQKELLQDAPTLQWGSLKRSRCSQGLKHQPKHCNSVDEFSKSKIATARKRNHPCSPPTIAAEHANEREKRLRNCDSMEGKRGVSVQGGKRASLQAPQEFLPMTRSSFGKKITSPENQLSSPTDGLEDGPARKDFLLSRFVITLSRKEIEEDFLMLKGSKLSKRPKRRPRAVEKALLYSNPGNWLSDVSHIRYNVREKKCVKQNPRGLKAMESIDTDSE